jgi:hypothetical protein
MRAAWPLKRPDRHGNRIHHMRSANPRGILIDMSTSFLILLSFLIGGGSGDLLDYVPTQSYWHDCNVEVTVETMLHEAAPLVPADISKLIADLGSTEPRVRDAASDHILKVGIGALPQLREGAVGADPEVAERSAELMGQLQPLVTVATVRRLMALRALGELKDASAIPFLQSQLNSQGMFVPDYARRAIAAIYGQQARPAIPVDAMDEVWLLPSNCHAVAQLIPRGNGPIDPQHDAAQVPVQAGRDGTQQIANLSKTALGLAETFGELRLDSLDIGVSEQIDDNHGWITVIASGQFDSETAARVLRGQKAATRTVDGMRIFEPDGESTMFFPSDHEFVMLVSPNGEEIPLADMIAAVRTRQQTLRKSPAIAALVEPMVQHDPASRHALWIAIQVTQAYRKLLGLDGFNTVALSGDEKGGALHISLRGESPDAQTAEAAVQQLTRMTAEGTAILNLLATQPSLQPALDFMSSIKLQSKANVVTGSAVLQESPAELYMLPLMMGMDVHGE